ncbi:MAG: SET domain-containing protein-lysine N-methyltransferase [Candidatus Acidiferrales bacterium]
MPSRTSSPKMRRTITPGASRYRLKVRRSPIHRWGVFAEEAISARRKVIEYTGELVPYSRVLKAHKRHWKSSLHTAVYLASLNKRWVINGAVGGNGAELINHCCDPNLAYRRAGVHMLFFSRRKIKKGEELTLDYRFHPDAEQIPCHCGSASCRGTINGERKRKRR